MDMSMPMMPGLEEGAMAGVAPILRWDRATDAIDTLGFVPYVTAGDPDLEATRRLARTLAATGGQ